MNSLIATLCLVTVFLAGPLQAKELEKATFAGGCFWCMEPPFEKLDGVESVVSGFAGGKVKNPAYRDVAQGKTKHLEAVQVTYDPVKVSYAKLLKTFWKNIDPTDDKGQFVDKGYQYTTAIFHHSTDQAKLAHQSKKFIVEKKYFKSIVTPIREFTTFYPAEDYHQDFYKRTLVTRTKYKYYRAASGRDAFINKHWKGKNLDFDKVPISPSIKKAYQKPDIGELKKKLTADQFHITQENGTERPFRNAYWDNKQAGIYVDVVSGEPLFSSLDKFKSGTGWPSFSKALVAEHIVEKKDSSWFRTRTEVRSKFADSHLGHVFTDGPKPKGLRYCINSAALRFVRVEDLEKENLGEFRKLFDKGLAKK